MNPGYSKINMNFRSTEKTKPYLKTAVNTTPETFCKVIGALI